MIPLTKILAMIFNEALTNIDNGKLGLNDGFNTGLPRLSEYMPGIQPGNIIVVGGETGSAKSTLAINNFIYNPYEDFITRKLDVNFKVFIWSCEMSKSAIGTRAICRQMYLRHKKLVDVNYVLSRGENRVSTEIYKDIVNLKDYFEQMSDHIEILNTDNPTGIRNTIIKHIKANGTIKTKPLEIKDKVVQVFDSYEPHKKGSITIGLVDHIGIIKGEQGLNKKARIDKLMEYQIETRDKYGVTWIDVQQLNRSLSSTDRFKQGSVEPQLSDFKESSDSTDAANFVLAIFSPQRYEISPYRGFKINKKDGGLGDRFRSIKLLKSRDGAADVIIGTFLIGECGLIKELPMADKMTSANYKQINSLQKIK
jgi:replicative DNA helicase